MIENPRGSSARLTSGGGHEETAMYFSIDSDYAVTAFEAGQPTSGPEAIEFASLEEFRTATAGWQLQGFVELWNSFAGVAGPFANLKPVKKFMDRKTATTRIWNVLQYLAPEKAQTASVQEQPAIAPLAAAKPKKQAKGKKPAAAKKPKAKAAAANSSADQPTAKSRVLAMIQRKNGATLGEIMAETGWQSFKHTVRGFMAGAMKRAGIEVESFKPEGGERTYRASK
jgi:hypothetical protein